MAAVLTGCAQAPVQSNSIEEGQHYVDSQEWQAINRNIMRIESRTRTKDR
jgi:hypothetical protein